MENRIPNCTCNICNKEIYRRPFQIRNGPVFCSTYCSNKRKQHLGKPCPICNNLLKRNTKYCSRECSNKGRVGIKYGIGSPNDNAAKYKKIKDILISIRGAKCNRCEFDKIEIIQVHHKKERSKGGGDEHDNLELLCPNCHVWHHYITNTKIEY